MIEPLPVEDLNPQPGLDFRTWLTDWARPMKPEQKAARVRIIGWFHENPNIAPPHPLVTSARRHVPEDIKQIRLFLRRTFPHWDTDYGLAAGPNALIDNYRVWRNRTEMNRGPYTPPK